MSFESGGDDRSSWSCHKVAGLDAVMTVLPHIDEPLAIRWQNGLVICLSSVSRHRDAKGQNSMRNPEDDGRPWNQNREFGCCYASRVMLSTSQPDLECCSIDCTASHIGDTSSFSRDPDSGKSSRLASSSIITRQGEPSGLDTRTTWKCRFLLDVGDVLDCER